MVKIALEVHIQDTFLFECVWLDNFYPSQSDSAAVKNASKVKQTYKMRNRKMWT